MHSFPAGTFHDEQYHGVHLFRYFIVLSIIAVFSILFVVGIGLHGVMNNLIIFNAEKETLQICALLRDLEADTFIHIEPDGDQQLKIDPEQIPEFDRRIRDFLAPFKVVKIKIFDLNTKIIYSTDKTIIGKLNPDNRKLNMALSGVSVSKLESKEQVWDLAEEERFDIELVETYVPVVGDGGRIIGSFEIYKDASSYRRGAAVTLARSIGIIALVLVIAFGILNVMMYRAVRTIQVRTAALQESEMKFRDLVETSHDLIWRCDAEGRFIYLNPAWKKTHGYRLEEMLGRSFTEFGPSPEIAVNNFQEFYQSLEDGLVTGYEIIHLSKAGKWLNLVFNAIPLRNADGRIVGTQGTAMDVTEYRRTEEEKDKLREELIQTEKLASLGEITAGIAHELNTPLGIILGYLELMAKKIGHESPNYEYIKISLGELERCRQLIKDFMLYVRPADDKLQRETVNIKGIVDDTIRLLVVRKKHNIKVNVEIEANLPHVKVSRKQIIQIFLNLISNAFQAMHNGGAITISIKHLKNKDIQSDGGIIEFRVKDTGVGIKEENIEKVFESFFTTKPSGQGTGLGLSICRRIMENHDGTIRIESEPGKGTTVIGQLPVNES